MEHVVDYILTDEFVEYSKQIAELHTAKKAKAEEIRALVTKAKADMAALDTKAVELTEAFEAWKTQKVKK